MLITAFCCLGLLVGLITGMTSSSVAEVLISLIFAFGGGSAIAFIHKLDEKARRIAAQLIIALTLSCTVGILSGIIISEYQFLTPTENRITRTSIEEGKYLRNIDMSDVSSIDQKLQNKEISIEEAYEELFQLLNQNQ